MADEQEGSLIEWAKNQPKWQQHALRLISKYGSAEAIPEDDKKQICKILIKEANGREPKFVPIKETDRSSAIATEPKTYLQSLGPVSKIDKLASGQEPFDFVKPNGITVIFGNNGSGKSGYARILKNLCRSHGEVRALKGDATSGTAANWKVDLTYAEKKSGEDEVRKLLQWTSTDEGKAESNLEYTPLERIAFFDSQVANTYVDGNRELFYLPPELRFYAELAILARESNEEVEEKVKSLKKQMPDLPKTTPGTSAYSVISKLESQDVSELSQEEVASICVFSDEEKQELKSLSTKEDNTPEQQKAILEAAKKTLIKLNDDMKKLDEVLSPEGLRRLLDNHQNYQDAKTKAEKNITDLAAEMPIKGLDSDVWFEMFKAARTFASEIYPDVAPPTIANAEHCVLCHQDLEKEAKERLELFDGFMNGVLQTTADEAKKVFNEGLKAISSLPNLDSEATKQQLQQYAKLSDDNKREVETITTDLAAITSRLGEVNQIIKENHFNDLQTLIDQGYNLGTDIPTLVPKITTEENSLDVLIEQGNGSLSSDEQSKLSELIDKEQCVDQKINIEKYFKLSKKIILLNSCKDYLKTNRITSQSKKRSPELYSEDLKARYTNEISTLGLKYLNISIDNTASIGEQRVVTEIEGLGKDKKSEILSEGEQRAVALAGFLTEVNESSIGHAIIFDDPVSSLDWDRRGLIAERLAEEAKKRQVIVFTHDFSFALQLEKYAKDKNGGSQEPYFKQLWIGKKSIGTELQFGITGETVAAWESKKVDQRLRIIEEKITELEESRLVPDGTGTSEFDRDAAEITKQLRQTWERAVEEIALNETIRRLYPNVMTTKLEQVQFDCTQDYQTLHQGMSAISTPAHDSPEHGGRASLTLEQLKENKDLLKNWVAGLTNKRRQLIQGENNVPRT